MRMLWWWACASLTATCVNALAATPSPAINSASDISIAPSAPPSLFTPADARSSAVALLKVKAAALAPATTRERAVTLQRATLSALRNAMPPGADARVVRLPFFEDADFTAALETAESTLSGGVAFAGRLTTDAMSSVILITNKDAISFNISTQGRRFRVTGNDVQGYVASELAPHGLPDHDRPVPVVNLPDTDVSVKKSNAAKASGGASGGVNDQRPIALVEAPTAADNGTQMDVMVMYTNTARAAAGGTAQMEADIDAQIAFTNQMYANSGVVQRLRLVHRGEVTHVEGDPDGDLRLIANPADTVLDELPILRDLYQADFVSLWGIYPSLCGIAFFMGAENVGFAGSAYSIVNSPSCSVGNSETFAHELGHNMGLDHDPFVTSSITRLSPEGSTTNVDVNYAHGYVDTVNRFRTVMAYNDKCVSLGFGCFRAPHFSNPAISYLNPTYGPAVTATTGDAMLSNEALALNNTRETTANFRQGIPFFNGPGVVPMLPAAYRVKESAGVATITVTRHLGGTGAVSVNYSTADGTGTAGQDYAATTGTLTWADGDRAPKSFTVPILQDNVLEGLETFIVNFGNPTNGLAVATTGGIAGSVTVNIIDDDPDTFPAGLVVPANYVNDANAARAWSVDPDDGFQSPTSIRSAVVIGLSSNQQTYEYSTISVTENFLAGNATFAYKVSSGVLSTTVFGNLEFLIDGNIAFSSGGGETGWQTTSVAIPAGMHTLSWRFRNRFNAPCNTIASAICQDRAWIDQVSLPLVNASLSVLKDGTGSGTVNALGINCGADCVTSVPHGTLITLTATADVGSIFQGWTGSGCSGNGACTTTVNGAQTVTAHFIPTPEVFPPACALPLGWSTPAGATAGWQVATDRKHSEACSLKSAPIAHAPAAGQANATKAQIQVSGDYLAGTVSFFYNVSSESGYDCLRFMIDGTERAEMGACSGAGGNGGSGASGEVGWTAVSIPVAAGNHTFLWSYEKNQANSTGQDAAWIDDVVLPSRVPVLLTIAKNGSGGGVVTGGAINCGTTCTALIAPDTLISLNAVPDALSQFIGWSGGDCSGVGNCIVTLSSATTVTATFVRTHIMVSVTLTGTGSGSVLSSPAGINSATGNLSAVFPIGTVITLTATPASSASIFAGWSGACTGQTCATTLMSDIATTATFTSVATVPSVPTLIGTVPGNGQISVLFNPSASDGGSPILNYTAQCNAVIVNGAGSPITVTGLTNGANHICRVTATNAVGTSAASTSSSFTVPTATPTPTLIGALSRRNHVGLGNVDLPLPIGVALSGAIGVEPRQASGLFVIAQFNTPLTAVGGVTVTDAGGAPAGSGTVSFTGSSAEIAITDVADNKRVNTALTGINGTATANIPIGFLVGDVTRSQRVNAADIVGIRARIGQPLTAANARFDLNGDGVISSSDVSAAKARAGKTIP